MDKVLTRKLFKDKYLQTVSKKVSHFKDGGLAGLKNELEQYAPKGEFLAYINKKEANVLKALGGSGRIVKETGIPSFAEDTETNLEEAVSNASAKIDPKLALKLLSTPDVYPVYSEGERQAMLLAPIASQLLTGTQQPGQSQLGAVASNVGAAIPKVMETSMAMRKLESDRLANIAKLAKSNTAAADPYTKSWQAALAKKDVENYGIVVNEIRLKRRDKGADGFFHIDGRLYELLEGTRTDVWNGKAYQTAGGLIKRDLLINKDGKIVSKSKSIEGTINNKLDIVNQRRRDRIKAEFI